MVSLRRVPLLAVLVWAWTISTANATDYAFVFHQGSTASVYDTESLGLVATPVVGENALQAIGVPDAADPTRFIKIYVINDKTVRVLEPTAPFATVALTPLPKKVNFVDRAGLLTPDAKWLLVAAESTLFVFDAQNPSDPTVQLVEMGQVITSIGVEPDANRAYLSIAGSTDVQPVGLQTSPPQRLAGPVVLPEIPNAVTVAPNGAGLYAASPGLLYDVDLKTNAIRDTLALDNSIPRFFDFDAGAPLNRVILTHGNSISMVTIATFTRDFGAKPPVVVDKLIAPSEDQVFVLSRAAKQIFDHTIGGGFDQLRDPRSLTTLRSSAIDMELDLAGKNLFVLYERDNELFRLSADAKSFGALTGVPSEPVGLSILSTTSISPDSIGPYGGGEQVAPEGQNLPRPLTVRVTDSNGVPAFGVEVAFSSFESGVGFDPATAMTNRFGVAATDIRVPTDDEFSIRAQTTSGQVSEIDLNTGSIAEGALTVLSGDFQAVMENSPLPREIQIKTVSAGVALPNTELTITPNNAAVVCPATATTNSKGIATFSCASADTLFSPFPTFTRIAVEDTFGRALAEPIRIRVAESENDMPRDPRKEKRGIIRGVAGGITTDAVQLSLLLVSGFGPVPNVAVEFETDRNVTPIPLIAPSDPFGFIKADIQFGCRRGTGTFKTSLNAPGLPEDEFEYEIVAGPASSLVRLQGNNQIGAAGERLDGPGQALLARVTDSCGNPVGGVPVSWSVSPEGFATLENQTLVSNTDGRLSTLVRLGRVPGQFSVTATVEGASTTFDLEVEVTATQLVNISGTDQQLQSGVISQPLVVEVRGDGGTPVGNEDVVFAIVQGQGVLVSPTSVTTDAGGRAFALVQAGSQIGPLVVEATAVGQTTTFNLTVVGRLPSVSTLGFVNGASFISGWVPGSLGSIFGVGLMEGINGVVQAGFAPFPTELRNVRVLVNDVPAPIISMANINGQEQINVQVPFSAPSPADNLVVTIENNGSSASFAGVRTFIVQPGIFEFTLPQGRFAAALHADFSLVEPANPAKPGEVILLFYTGGGPVEPAIATNQAGPVPAAAPVNEATVTLNGVIQESLGAFYAPTLFTVYQANFRVDENAQDGNLEIQVIQRGAPSPVAILPVKR